MDAVGTEIPAVLYRNAELMPAVADARVVFSRVDHFLGEGPDLPFLGQTVGEGIDGFIGADGEISFRGICRIDFEKGGEVGQSQVAFPSGAHRQACWLGR
ncbi:hypothetical protein G039_0328565 [Pseudomonas aeruginosa VRFPA01]|nr:hypothetical protein G039_0328565 [Pseudomonas aeruginosa VRFPA01]